MNVNGELTQVISQTCDDNAADKDDENEEEDDDDL